MSKLYTICYSGGGRGRSEGGKGLCGLWNFPNLEITATKYEETTIYIIHNISHIKFYMRKKCNLQKKVAFLIPINFSR